MTDVHDIIDKHNKQLAKENPEIAEQVKATATRLTEIMKPFLMMFSTAYDQDSEYAKKLLVDTLASMILAATDDVDKSIAFAQDVHKGVLEHLKDIDKLVVKQK